MNKLQLSFVRHGPESYLATLTEPASVGTCDVLLHPWGNEAMSVVRLAAKEQRAVRFFAASPDREARIAGVAAASASKAYDAIFLFHQNPAELSKCLLEYLDLQNGHLVAPLTDHYFESRPLFLISIPKSGTHLLYELAEAFGYRAGIVCPDNPLGGHWYCVEYSNSHTVARDFFVDTVRRSPFGNRHHPFPRCPALFIYRNPLDIVVSEANYYHRDGASAFGGYLADKPFAERLLRLINDPWLLGSIRDRIVNFAPWLDFPNVVPVSFEELIGPNGGGNLDVQSRLIWSLQLKLHVPGNPQDFGNRVFNRDSATFHAGRIGAHAEAFTDEARKAFDALPQDFMETFGYRTTPTDAPLWRPFAAMARSVSGSTLRRTTFSLSSRTGEFRRRPVKVSTTGFDDVPIAVQSDFLGHNIVRYQRRHIAVPQSLGPVNIAEAVAANPRAFLTGPDLESVKRAVVLATADAPTAEPEMPPRLVQSLSAHNIVFFRNCYFVIPMALGPVDLEAADARSIPGILSAGTLDGALNLAQTLESNQQQKNEVNDAAEN